MESTDPKTTIIRVSLVFAICILLVFFIYGAMNGKKESKKSALSQQATVVNKGNIHLQVAPVSLEKTIALTVVASSDKKQVIGYDAVITYDSALVSFKSQQSLLSDFDTVSQPKTGSIIISGFKKLSVQTPAVFENTVLAQVMFTVKKSGPVSFQIQYEPNATTDSNLMTDAKPSVDILGSTQGLTVNNGETVRLSKGVGIPLPNTVLNATLTALKVPTIGCADCITTVDIQVVKGTEKKMLKFQSGGLAGNITGQQQAFGYNFEVTSLTANTVTITYYLP